MTFNQLCNCKPSEALQFALGAFLEKGSLELMDERKPLGRHFSASGNTVNRFGLIAIAKASGFNLSATSVLEDVVHAKGLDKIRAHELDRQLDLLRSGNTMGYFFARGWSKRKGFEMTTRIAHYAFNPVLFKSNIETLIFKLKENGY